MRRRHEYHRREIQADAGSRQSIRSSHAAAELPSDVRAAEGFILKLQWLRMSSTRKSIAVFLSITALLFGVQLLHLSSIQLQTDGLSFQAPVDTKPITHDEKIVTLIETNRSTELVQTIPDVVTEPTLVHNYKCYPPRHWQSPNITNTIVYIELAWFNMHSETFYSFVEYFCSCKSDKYPQWKLDTRSVPHFYFGPENFVRPDLRRIFHEYNQTTCGPILFGTPSKPTVTLHTTTYATDWYGKNPNFPHMDKINQPGHVFICHNNAPRVERTSNIIFLTPVHDRYIVPSYFPPTIVERSHRALDEHPNRPPVFLVLGSFLASAGNQKRNIASLKQAMTLHRDKNFTVHFLGGGSEKLSNETLMQHIEENFREDYDKVRATLHSEADVFMDNVGGADVILPLVDETNFRIEYQNGQRLTSAVSWGL